MLEAQENEWNQSHWFKEWLFMARDREMSNGRKAYLSPEHKKVEIAHPPTPDSEWNFSLQENTTLSLPKINSRFTEGTDSLKYMDAPHAFQLI